MVFEPSVSAIVPSFGSISSVPLFARQGPSGRFPRFLARIAALRLPGSLLRSFSLAVAVPPLDAAERRDLPSSSITLATHAPIFDPGRAVKQASGVGTPTFRFTDVAFRGS